MGDESTHSPWKRARHAFEFAMVSAISAVVRSLPRRAALGVGAGLGALVWATGIRRRMVLDNLARALPDATPDECRRIAAQAARNFGRTAIEFLRFRGRDRQRVLDLVQLEGLDAVHDALAEGKGAVLVTAHLGAWALYVTALAAAGIPSALLVGVQSNARINDLILGIPGDAVQFISKSKTAPRQILGALKANKVIVLVADHYSSDQRVYAPFMGRPAFTHPLPGALVEKHGLPLIRMVGHREDGGRHRVTLSRLGLPEFEDADATRLGVAVCFNAALGESILEHPDQYFWYHNRWKVRTRKTGPRWSTEAEVAGG